MNKTQNPLASAEVGADALQAIGRTSDARVLRELVHKLRTNAGPMALLYALGTDGEERAKHLEQVRAVLEQLDPAPAKKAPAKKAPAKKAKS